MNANKIAYVLQFYSNVVCTEYFLRGLRFFVLSEIQTVGDEVRKGTKTKITCIVSNVLPKGVSVNWINGNTSLTKNVETSLVTEKQQVSTLTVENPLLDSVYTCVIRSNTYNKDQTYSKRVNLDVYGWYFG